MKELILVRHAEAQYMVDNLTGGWTDTPLTDRGRHQAQQTGAALRALLGTGPFAFYASDLARASETAKIIGTHIHAVPVCARELRDFNNGLAANRPHAEAEALSLPVTQPIMDSVPYPGAESWRTLWQRVAGFMDALQRRDIERAVLVTHASAIVCILQWWLQLPDALLSKTSFDAEPCSITRCTANEWGERKLTKLNDTAHLGPR
jgi:probable phosphoglycerate mutase